MRPSRPRRRLSASPLQRSAPTHGRGHAHNLNKEKGEDPSGITHWDPYEAPPDGRRPLGGV